MSTLSLSQSISAVSQKAVEDRRWFHQHAELSNQEFETTDYICRELSAMGLEVLRPTPTGAIGILHGEAGPGPTLGLRADIDALPLQEENDVPYCSQNTGVMHACGHDAHAAALLAAARLLAGQKAQLYGTVKFIFQPAEEYFPSGAAALLKSGKLDDVDAFCGVHVMTAIPRGKICVQSGALMAASCTIKIHVTGKGGHGGMPHDAVDATVVAASILLNLQTYISRERNPHDATVVSIGTFHSGTAINIISEKAELAGTIRYFDPSSIAHTQECLRRIAVNTATALGATAEVEFIPGLDATINDAAMAKLGCEVCEELWDSFVVCTTEPAPGCDDFCYYGLRKPSLYVLVGAANEAKGIVSPHHNPKFDIDEACITDAAAFYAAFALRYNQG